MFLHFLGDSIVVFFHFLSYVGVFLHLFLASICAVWQFSPCGCFYAGFCFLMMSHIFSQLLLLF